MIFAAIDPGHDAMTDKTLEILAVSAMLTGFTAYCFAIAWLMLAP